MNKLLLATAAVAFAAVGTAGAADLPMKAPPMAVAAPVASWTGCYVGIGGGYKMWNINHQAIIDGTGVVNDDQGDAGGRGWLATGQVGCDYQFASSWVIGAFADWDWTNAKGNYNNTIASRLLTISGDMHERWSAAAGVRLGYLVHPGLLTFVSGGWTEAQFDDTSLVGSCGGPGCGQVLGAPSGLVLPGRRNNGWFIGGGAEYNIPALPGLFWKTEYRFSTFSSVGGEFTCVGVGFACAGATGAIGITDQSKLYQQAVRSELVYRFNWGGPVVARY